MSISHESQISATTTSDPLDPNPGSAKLSAGIVENLIVHIFTFDFDDNVYWKCHAF